MKLTSPAAVALSAGAVLLAGCATPAGEPDVSADFAKMMQTSFRDQGIAKVDRLQQDLSNAECSKAEGKPLPDAVAEKIQEEARKTVKLPADGRFLGDWRKGERLAQNGRGMTWTDASAATSANGGNCYNCHQLDPKEISYGTIGPSLYNYGKLRGVADVKAETARPIIEYTWTKLYNAKSYGACSGMPRFGHAGLLSEKQLQDLMALLLDPQSPVNR